MSLDTLRPASELAADRPHGVRLKYMGGCRCNECRRANTQYEIARSKARKAGDWNGFVSAARARRHMLNLSKRGIGRRTIQAATDIADSVLHLIRSGKRPRIRARTERKILAVTREILAESSFVPAAATWKRIKELRTEGFTNAEIARRLGYKGPGLQFNKVRVQARTEAKVAAFYSRYMT